MTPVQNEPPSYYNQFHKRQNAKKTQDLSHLFFMALRAEDEYQRLSPANEKDKK